MAIRYPSSFFRSLPPLLLAASLFLSAPLSSFALADWKTLKTNHFIVFYQPGYETEAWKALQSLE